LRFARAWPVHRDLAHIDRKPGDSAKRAQAVTSPSVLAGRFDPNLYFNPDRSPVTEE
jgi:hypothetical protein